MTETDKEFYGRYADILEEKERWLYESLQDILDQVSTDPETKPAEHILCRIKSTESLREKLRKRGLADDVDVALRYLSDIIGVRIVVHFVGDVYEILNRIRKSESWKVTQVKDYVTFPKENGYRSLHVILSIPFMDGEDEIKELQAEVQLRTIAMDCWASLEHQLRYKKSIENAELIGAELSRCAAEMASTDLTLQTIREMIQNGTDTEQKG